MIPTNVHVFSPIGFLKVASRSVIRALISRKSLLPPAMLFVT